jgi:hypothetical protein
MPNLRIAPTFLRNPIKLSISKQLHEMYTVILHLVRFKATEIRLTVCFTECLLLSENYEVCRISEHHRDTIQTAAKPRRTTDIGIARTAINLISFWASSSISLTEV